MCLADDCRRFRSFMSVVRGVQNMSGVERECVWCVCVCVCERERERERKRERVCVCVS